MDRLAELMRPVDTHKVRFETAFSGAQEIRRVINGPDYSCPGQFTVYTKARISGAKNYLLEVLPGIRTEEDLRRIEELLDSIPDPLPEA